MSPRTIPLYYPPLLINNCNMNIAKLAVKRKMFKKIDTFIVAVGMLFYKPVGISLDVRAGLVNGDPTKIVRPAYPQVDILPASVDQVQSGPQ